MLIRLFVLGGRIITLTGRWGLPEGEPGGELAIALWDSFVATKCVDGEDVAMSWNYDAVFAVPKQTRKSGKGSVYKATVHRSQNAKRRTKVV